MIGSRFDFDRYGLVPRSSPRQADLILTAGTVTMKMAPSLVRLYEQMPEPKYVIAMGACTITGGMFSTDSYSTVRGVDKLIPVDIYLPGCPPKPEAIIDSIVRLRKKVAQESIHPKNYVWQKHKYHTTRHSLTSSLPIHTGVYLQSKDRKTPPSSLQPFTNMPDFDKYPLPVLQERPVSKTITMASSRSYRFSYKSKSPLWANSSKLFNYKAPRTLVKALSVNQLRIDSLGLRVSLPRAYNKQKQDLYCFQATSSQPSLTKNDLKTSLAGGRISSWLAARKLENRSLGYDYQGVEVVQVKSNNLSAVALALYAYGFNYLRCQCAYDVSPGGFLASLCYLTRMVDYADQPEEICIKVLVSRIDPRVPSLFWLWKSADFQERESYDMFGILYDGHPYLRRILMPENWVGWPLRKDYITPSFYELSS